MMKKWTPPILLGLLVFAGLLYWLVSKRNTDDAGGVQSNIPSTPTDPDMVEEFGDGLDTEGAENTFEMSEDSKKARSTAPQQDGSGLDDSGVGQEEVDGVPRDDEDPAAGLGGIDGSDGGEPIPVPVPGVDTIDDDDGETIDPSKAGQGAQGQTSGPSESLGTSGQATPASPSNAAPVPAPTGGSLEAPPAMPKVP